MAHIVRVIDKPVDNLIQDTLSRLSSSSDQTIGRMFDGGNLEILEIEYLLDPNQDGKKNLDDLIWHNQRLNPSRRIKWMEFKAVCEEVFGVDACVEDLSPRNLSGNVVHLGQTHFWNRDLNEYLSILKKTRPRKLGQRVLLTRRTQERKAELERNLGLAVQSQKKIYRYLKNNQARHIFDEAAIEASYVRPDQTIFFFMNPNMKLKDLKVGYSNPKKMPVNIFYAVAGGALKYVSENTDATIYPVTTPEVKKRREDHLARLIDSVKKQQISTDDFKRLYYETFKPREAELKWRVERFLAENPGETVYITYGSDHELSYLFEGSGEDFTFQEINLSSNAKNAATYRK